MGTDSIKEGDVFKFSVLSRNLDELLANFSLTGSGINGELVALERWNVILLEDQLRQFDFDVKSFECGANT